MPLISFVNCKNSRICQHILSCGLLFSASPFILDPHKNVRNAKSVAIAIPGPSLCSWAGAVLGCPCLCLPWFLLLWKLDSLEQHLQAFAGRGEKRKSPECLAAPLQHCPVLQCHGSEDVRLNFSMEKRFVNPAEPDMLSRDTFVYLRKWHVSPLGAIFPGFVGTAYPSRCYLWYRRELTLIALMMLGLFGPGIDITV